MKDDESSESEDDEDHQAHSNEITLDDNPSSDIKPLQQSLSLSNFIHCRDKTRSEEEFSDDSLENANNEQSTQLENNIIIPPPVPLENDIPIMSDKCSPGIAWEIKLDENNEEDKPVMVSCNSSNVAFIPTLTSLYL